MRRTAEDAAGTRASLLDAVLAVVARRGYSATRLDEVATEAGVTRGALYHHFKAGKAELFNAAVAARWGELAGHVFAALDEPGEPLHRIERFIATYVHRVGTEPRFRELLEVLILRTGPTPELQAGREDKERSIDGWREALMPLLRQARLRPGLEPEDAAAIVITVLYGVTAQRGGNDRIAEIIVRGLAP